MEPGSAQSITIDFPGDIEYIPSVRKFVNGVIGLREFSRRFAFRTEIVIDELCNNAIKFGRPKIGQFITLSCRITDDDITIDVFNPASDPKNLGRLKQAAADRQGTLTAEDFSAERGIKIIKILTSGIQVIEGEKTCVRVVKKKEDTD